MITLLTSVSDSDTTFSVTADSSLPQSNGLLTIGTEQITYTDNYMGTLYGVTRGVNSTTPASHVAGTSLTLSDFYSAPSAGVTFPLSATDGDAAAPAYGFASNSKAGIWYDSDNNSMTLQMNTSGDDSQIVVPTGVAILFGEADYSESASITVVGGSFIISAFSIDTLTFDVNQIAFHSGSAAVPAIRFALVTDNGFYEPSTTSVGVAAAGVAAATFDNSVAAGETRMLLWDVDSGALKRVSVGANDSGGAGFKLLRVPNA